VAFLAEISLEPGGVIAWLVVGLVSGFLASRFMGSGGYGLIGDIVVGLVGAFVGGFVFGLVFTGTYALIGSIVVAFLGACLLIWVVRRLVPGSSYA
jgi:uncharacterized membrane protein YeaQ/YmgE (transglycosylase-associated protein family)